MVLMPTGGIMGQPRHSHGPQGALGGIYDKAPSAEDVSWQLRGLCRLDDPQLWTPDPPDVEFKSQEAKKICLGHAGAPACPVLQECRDWALEHREKYGVWGGMTEGDRDAYWAGRRRIRRDHRSVASFYQDKEIKTRLDVRPATPGVWVPNELR